MHIGTSDAALCQLVIASPAPSVGSLRRLLPGLSPGPSILFALRVYLPSGWFFPSLAREHFQRAYYMPGFVMSAELGRLKAKSHLSGNWVDLITANPLQ